MKFLTDARKNLEKIALGDNEPLSTPITEARIGHPTVAALATTIALSAGAATGATHVTDNAIVNSLISHSVELVGFTPLFIGYYLGFNKPRYTIDGKYSYRHALYDVLAKVVPAGGVSGPIIDLFIRNPFNVAMMYYLKINPTISTALTATILAVPHYFARMQILKAGSTYLGKDK